MSDVIIHKPEKGRFLIKTAYGKAKLKYEIDNNRSMNIKKTKVPHKLRGLGLGKKNGGGGFAIRLCKTAICGSYLLFRAKNT